MKEESENKAKEYFEKGIEFHYKQRDYEQANVYYLKAIEKEWDYLDAINALAQNLRLNFKNYKSAIFYYTRVIDIDPLFDCALFRRGLCKEALKDYKGRIDDLSLLMKLEPNSSYYVSRAIVKMKINDLVGVIEDCTLAIESKIHVSFAHRFRGDAKFKLFEFNGAIDDFEKVIEIENCNHKNSIPYSISMYLLYRAYGKAKFSLNEYQGALSAFKKSASFNSKHPDPIDLIHKTKKKLRLIDEFYDHDFFSSN